jgi:tetratricopeptide (TPR) repeat protein
MGSHTAAVMALLLVPLTLWTASTSTSAQTTTSSRQEEARKFAAQAEKAFASGNLKLAESLYTKSLEAAPENASLLVSLAAVETRLGNLEASQVLLRQALRIDLSNGPAWMLLGMNALELKQDDEAFADLVQATLRDEQNPRTHNYLGMAAGRKGWTEASEQELRRAVELDQRYADANFNLAVLYLRRTPPLIELARRHYQRAIDLGAPRDPAIEKLITTPVTKTISELPASAPLP